MNCFSSNLPKETVIEELPKYKNDEPEFIYGGPFIIDRESMKPGFFLDSATPYNTLLQGTYKKSFAYYSLKERMPVILTKVIDQLSKEGAKDAVHSVAKLKSDLVTNKMYEPLNSESDDARRWNEWIASQPNQSYFNNTWIFTECYVYRKLQDCIETCGATIDPFFNQKQQAFNDAVEAMCVVADKLKTLLENKENKMDTFKTLLKVCLWSNKCDLSLSCGAPVSMQGESNPGAAPRVMDPFAMIEAMKVNVIVDDSNKINLDSKIKAVDPNDPKLVCTCDALAFAAGEKIINEEKLLALKKEKKETKKGSKKAPKVEAEKVLKEDTEKKTEEPEEKEQEKKTDKVPCPAKVVDITKHIVDIVCDNAGYELFADLALADHLLTSGLTQLVRFHVKNIPWFVSDVTRNDFTYVINACANASYSKQYAGEVKAGEEGPPQVVSSNSLAEAGARWKTYVEEGKFVVMSDDFWTSPHVFKDMKKHAPRLYRKLQFATLVVFKGDLNYRKLLGEMNWNPTTTFEKGLQGFHPAPLVTLRTVKADLICGLPKGKQEQLNAKDPQWMEKGDYGVIQFCKKRDPIKVSDRPCADYGTTCLGGPCPVHTDLY